MEQVLITIQKAEIGQVFYAIWGYDQTNYDYVIIKDISPSGKTAVCQLAEFQEVAQTAQHNIQKPIKKGFGCEFRLKIEHDSDGKPQLRGSYPFCSVQVSQGAEFKDCSTRLGTLWLAKENETFAETDGMFGH